MNLNEVTLTTGERAQDYVDRMPKDAQRWVEAGILECLRLGYPLNDLEVTSKSRELRYKEKVRG